MNESFKNEGIIQNYTRNNKFKLSHVLNDSSIIEEKKDIDHRITLAEVRHFNINSKPKKKTFVNYWSKFRYKIYKLIDNIYFQIVILFIALYALFYKEILLLSLPEYFDDPMEFAIEIFFFILLFEFMVCLMAKKNYFGSFDFFIDLISLIGLIPEVKLLWDNILDLISHSSEKGIHDALTVSHIGKTTHVSQVGSKAGRYFKLLRLINFMKIVRIAKIIKASGQIRLLKNEKEKINILGHSKNVNVKNRKRRQNLTMDQKRNFGKLVELGIKYNKASLNPTPVISNDLLQIVERKKTDIEDGKTTERELLKDFDEIDNQKEKKIKNNKDGNKIISHHQKRLSALSRRSRGNNNIFTRKPAHSLKENNSLKLNLIHKDEIVPDINDSKTKNKNFNVKFKRINLIQKTTTIEYKNLRHKFTKALQVDPIEMYSESDEEKSQSISNSLDSVSESDNSDSLKSQENVDDYMNEKEEEIMNNKIELYKQINKLHMNEANTARNSLHKHKITDNKTNKDNSHKHEEFLQKVSKKSNSKIQKILNESMMKQVVSVIMLILVILPIIDYDFLLPIIFSSDLIPTRHHFCLDTIFMQMNYTLYNSNRDSLDILNKTITNCFYTNGYRNNNDDLPTEIERFIYINFNESDVFWQLYNQTGYKFFTEKYKIAINDYEHYLEENRYYIDFIKEIYSIDDYNNLTFIYEIAESNRILQICTILKSIYVSIFLVFGVYFSTMLINLILITPLDIIFTKLSMNLKNVETISGINDESGFSVAHVFKLNDLFNNSDLSDAYMIQPMSKEDKILKSGAETYFIDESLIKMLNMISISIGNIAFPIIPYSNLNREIELNLTKTPLISYEGVGLFLFIENTDLFFRKYQHRCHSILSEIYTIFHSIGIIFSGEPYHKTELNAIFWKKNKSQWLKETNRYVIELVSGKKSQAVNDLLPIKDEVDHENIFDEIFESLATFSGMKFLYVIFKDLFDTVKILKECKVKLSLFVKNGLFIHGLFGTDNLIEEVYTGETIEQMLKISSHHEYPSLYILQDSYNSTIEEIKKHFLPYEVIYDEENQNRNVIYRHFFNYYYFSNYDGENLFSYQNINNYTIFKERKDLEKQITKDKLGFLNFVLSDESYFHITEGFNQSLRTLSNLLFKSFEQFKYSKCLELIKDIKEVMATDEVEFDPVVKMKINELEKIFDERICQDSSWQENFTKILI